VRPSASFATYGLRVTRYAVTSSRQVVDQAIADLLMAAGYIASSKFGCTAFFVTGLYCPVAEILKFEPSLHP
jgi:hypothetical protein